MLHTYSTQIKLYAYTAYTSFCIYICTDLIIFTHVILFIWLHMRHMRLKKYIYVYNYIYNKLKQSMTFNAQAIHLRFRFWRFARHRRIRCGQTLWEAREKNDEKGMGDTLEMKMLIIQKHGDKWRRMEFSEELCSFLGWVWISQWWVLPSNVWIELESIGT